jgi:hypothetical protein
MRAWTSVAYEKRAAVFELAVNVDDGRTRSGKVGLNAIAGLENESADCGHRVF